VRLLVFEHREQEEIDVATDPVARHAYEYT